jgi:hypothetical protein
MHTAARGQLTSADLISLRYRSLADSVPLLQATASMVCGECAAAANYSRAVLQGLCCCYQLQ